jgi:hypothetical protein
MYVCRYVSQFCLTSDPRSKSALPISSSYLTLGFQQILLLKKKVSEHFGYFEETRNFTSLGGRHFFLVKKNRVDICFRLQLSLKERSYSQLR